MQIRSPTWYSDQGQSWPSLHVLSKKGNLELRRNYFTIRVAKNWNAVPFSSRTVQKGTSKMAVRRAHRTSGRQRRAALRRAPGQLCLISRRHSSKGPTGPWRIISQVQVSTSKAPDRAILVDGLPGDVWRGGWPAEQSELTGPAGEQLSGENQPPGSCQRIPLASAPDKPGLWIRIESIRIRIQHFFSIRIRIHTIFESGSTTENLKTIFFCLYYFLPVPFSYKNVKKS
jgi:hypothetical protein